MFETIMYLIIIGILGYMIIFNLRYLQLEKERVDNELIEIRWSVVNASDENDLDKAMKRLDKLDSISYRKSTTKKIIDIKELINNKRQSISIH